VSGLLHLAIGYLAIRIALGSGGGSADQSGALAAVAAKPGGIAALWVAAVAFLVMALWRLVETALGRSTEPKSQGAPSEVLDRAEAFALAVVYFAFAISASNASTNQRSDAIRAMYGAGIVTLSSSRFPSTPNRSVIGTQTPPLASTACTSAFHRDRIATNLALCRTSSRSSRVSGSAIQACGRRPIRNRSARSAASR
jgi:hypothetical protein